MENNFNTGMLPGSIMGGPSPIMGVYEDNDLEETQKKELEELIKNVPYSLCVALIKISQLHNYEPMDIDTLYQKILPAFPLLRRNDGSKYQSHSVNTVRSAMVSNKLYSKNPQGKYVLNVGNAIKIVKTIKNKKKINSKDTEITTTQYPSNNTSKKPAVENLDSSISFMNYEDTQNMDSTNLMPTTSTTKQKKIKVKKPKDIKELPKYKIEKYEKIFLVLKNLLKVSANDKMLYSQLNFDLASLADPSKLQDNKLNADKVIGMLCVFKFFKPFLEKSLNSVHCQENILAKLIDLTSEVQYMENLYKFDEE